MSKYTRPPLTKVQKTYGTAKCPVCDTEFEKKRDWQDFCSQKCQMKYWHHTHPRISTAVAPTAKMKKGK